MHPSIRASTLALALLASAALGACDKGGAASLPPADPSCTDAADIEDAENVDDQIIVQEGRNGYLYTYRDENGTTMEQAGDGYTPEWGGAQRSRAALRISGQLAQGEVYAGIGLGLTESGPYDASRYSGVSFLARRGPGEGMAQSVRVKLPDGNTDPAGEVCSECYNDFGIDFAVTEEWTRYTVNFADLRQEGGWGDPTPANLDPTKLFGIQFQVSASGKAYDLWIDDVTFIGCGG